MLVMPEREKPIQGWLVHPLRDTSGVWILCSVTDAGWFAEDYSTQPYRQTLKVASHA